MCNSNKICIQNGINVTHKNDRENHKKTKKRAKKWKMLMCQTHYDYI